MPERATNAVGNAQVLCFSAQMNTKADRKPVALVLGAAVWPGGAASPSLRRRVHHAVQLWRSGQVSAIVGTGGLGQHPPSEARVIANMCRAEGVPETAVFLEDRATNTEENLRFSKPILDSLGSGSAGAAPVVIVTDRYHAPRALLVARRLGIPATASCPALRGSAPHRVIKAYLREVPAYLWYWLRGTGAG